METFSCLVCLNDLSNKSKFGFSECFKSHSFCFDCFQKLNIDELRCPKDKKVSKTLKKSIENVDLDVDKYFIDKIKLFLSKNDRRGLQLIKELQTYPKSILSSSRCDKCFIDHIIPLKFGLSECFPRHKFCFSCVAEISRSVTFCCPIDNKFDSKHFVLSIGDKIAIRDKLYFHSIKYLQEKADERSFELIEEIQINGTIGHSVCCGCFKEYRNETVFGFDICFYNHSFCFDCVLKSIKMSSNCPIDGNGLKLIQKSIDNRISDVQFKNIEQMVSIVNCGENFERPYSQAEEMAVDLSLTGKKCAKCRREYELIFGLTECYEIHYFCLYCIENIIENKLKCPLDGNKCSGIKILINNSLIEIDRYYFKFIKRFVKIKSLNYRLLVDDIKACLKLSLQITVCGGCFSAQKYKHLFGFSHCFYKHGFCLICMENEIEKGLRCPIDKIDNEGVVVILDNVIIDVDRFYFLFLKYLRNLDAEKSMKLSLWVNFLKPFPKNVCIVCVNENKRDKYMFGYTDCIDSHRMCIDCTASRYCKNSHSECVLKHSKGSTALFSVQNIDYYCETSGGINEKQTVDSLFIKSFFYLSIKPVAERIDAILFHMRGTLTCFSNNFCIECLNLIPNASYGFKLCIKHHRFCENCIKIVTEKGNKCPVDDLENTGIYKCLQRDNSTTKIDQHYFRIMEHFQNLNFDKIRIKELRDNLYKNHFFQADLCFGCLGDVKEGEDGLLKCPFGHKMCRMCISTKAVTFCPIDFKILCLC